MTTQIRIPEMNIVLLTGRLTKDVTTSYTQKGVAVCRFDMAVNRRYMDASKNWQDEVTFVPVTIWGDAAERAKDRLLKGVPVCVEGRLVLNEYTDKTGQQRRLLQVNSKRVQILQSGLNSSASSGYEEDDRNIDDDVPF